MLNKTYQVLLEDWLSEYIEFLSKRYDLSISSIIRTHICLAIISTIPLIYPEHNFASLENELQELAKTTAKKESDEADIHKLISKVIFEARKAVEYRRSKNNDMKVK
jgi:hypothetical protein